MVMQIYDVCRIVTNPLGNQGKVILMWGLCGVSHSSDSASIGPDSHHGAVSITNTSFLAAINAALLIFCVDQEPQLCGGSTGFYISLSRSFYIFS